MQTSLLAVGLMCLGGAGWLVYQVWHGKRWARVLTLVFAIVEVIFLLRAIKWLVAANSLQRLLDLESVPLVVAVCLVFLTPGRRWFDKR